MNNRAQANLNKTNNLARRNTQRNDADGSLIANIDESWYLEFTPGYVRASSANVDTFWGATVSLGYRLTENDKIQLEIGYYRTGNYTSPAAYNDPFSYDYTVAGQPMPTGTDAMKVTGIRKTGSVTAIPVLLSYSYLLRLDAPGHYEIRFTPALGIVDFSNSSWSVENITGTYKARDAAIITDVTSTDGSFTAANISPDGRTLTKTAARIAGPGSSTNISLAMGIGVGFTWNFSSRVYADAGYRYLWTTKVANHPGAGVDWNGTSAWNGSNLSFFTLGLGWKF